MATYETMTPDYGAYQKQLKLMQQAADYGFSQADLEDLYRRGSQVEDTNLDDSMRALEDELALQWAPEMEAARARMWGLYGEGQGRNAMRALQSRAFSDLVGRKAGLRGSSAQRKSDFYKQLAQQRIAGRQQMFSGAYGQAMAGTKKKKTALDYFAQGAGALVPAAASYFGGPVAGMGAKSVLSGGSPSEEDMTPYSPPAYRPPVYGPDEEAFPGPNSYMPSRIPTYGKLRF